VQLPLFDVKTGRLEIAESLEVHRFVGVDKFSFPSGHATRCWALASAMVWLAENGRGESPALPQGPLVVPFIYAWGLAVSLSRIALGRHFVSDVLAGALVGRLATFPAALALTRRFASGVH